MYQCLTVSHDLFSLKEFLEATYSSQLANLYNSQRSLEFICVACTCAFLKVRICELIFVNINMIFDNQKKTVPESIL